MDIVTKFNFGDSFYYIGKYISPSNPKLTRIVVNSCIVTDIVLQPVQAHPFYYKFNVEGQIVQIYEEVLVNKTFTTIKSDGNQQFNFCFCIDKTDTAGTFYTLLQQVEKVLEGGNI